MRTRLLIRRIIVAITLASAAATAYAADLAERFPETTLAYVGWSSVADETEVGQLRRAVETLAGFDNPSPQEKQKLALALDLLGSAVQADGAIGLTHVGVRDGEPTFVIAAIIDAGVDSLTLQTKFEQLVDPSVTTEPLTVGGRAFKRVDLGDFQSIWGLSEDRFILVIGGADAEATAGTLVAGDGGLAQTPRFKQVRAATTGDAVPTFCLYADLAGGLARFKALAREAGEDLPPEFEQVMTESGLGAMQALYVTLDDRAGSANSHIYIALDGPRNGLLKLWQHGPLTDADLKLIPKDALWAVATNLNLRQLWDEGMRIFEVFAPDEKMEAEGGLQMVHGILGFSIPDQLLPALGDTWVLYDTPDHGGFLGSGTVMVVETADPNGLHAVGARLVQLAAPFAAQQDVRIEAVEFMHNGVPINYLAVRGLPVPIAPAACFVEDRMMLALSPQVLKVALSERLRDTPGGTILDHPEVQAARSKLPQRLQTFLYADTRAIWADYYGLFNAFRTAMVSLAGGEDVALHELPTLDEFLATTEVSIAGCAADDSAIHYAGQGSMTALAVGGGGMAALGTAVLWPSFGRARDNAKMAVSQSNLRQIAVGCLIYANDHDDMLPPDLQTLVSNGMLTEQVLNSPFADDYGTSYEYTGAMKLGEIKKPATHVLAYEEVWHQETILAVFADGHVEKLEPDRFYELLQKTEETVRNAKTSP